MNKKLNWLIGALLLISLSSSATDVKAPNNKKLIHSFKREFVGAVDVNWASTAAYYEATFTLGERTMTAYFLQTGKLVAVRSNITTSQLPVNLQLKLRKNYSGYWISEL